MEEIERGLMAAKAEAFDVLVAIAGAQQRLARLNQEIARLKAMRDEKVNQQINKEL